MTLQSVGAHKLFFTCTAHVQEEVLPNMSSKGGHFCCSIVTKEAGEGTLGAVDQQVAFPLQLVLKTTFTGGAMVEELSEALASFQSGD